MFCDSMRPQTGWLHSNIEKPCSVPNLWHTLNRENSQVYSN